MNKKMKQKLIELFNAGNFAEVEAEARRAIKKNPGDGIAWKALGAAVKKQDKDGLEATQKAVELLPNDYEAHFNLGVELQARGKNHDAISCYHRAISINPNSAKVHNNLGNALKAINKPYEALACYHKAMKLDPTMEEAYLNMGNDLLGMGKYSEAVECFKKVLDINPDFVEAYSNLIFTQDFMTNVSAEVHRFSRRDWAENYVDHLYTGEVNTNNPAPDRKIRVGYVSGDFKEHSAPRVFGGMLMEYDRARFEVYCYSNNPTANDSYTKRFRESATQWREIGKLKDPDVVQMIRDDEIDILVDLSGHSALNRLAVFAFHPAPVQITAWGYATATGLQKMDVFFADKVVVPENERHLYVEDVRYLPCVASSYFQEEFPPVNDLPALKNNIITFGCLNRLHKVSEECYRTWVEVLKAVPNSRLLLKAGELTDESSRSAVMWQFMKAGIDPERIKMIGATTWAEHVKAYNFVDLALDPFPHGGGVTTMEGLMMGVPVVTLRWPTLVGRLSASLMTTMGLENWIAETADDYVQLVAKKAADISNLAGLRSVLRTRFQNSMLGNHKAYVGAVEKMYRQLWREWCEKQSVTASNRITEIA